MYLTCRTVFLSVIFATFRGFASIANYGRYKNAIELGKSKCPAFEKGEI
jgi:hypothetical protein